MSRCKALPLLMLLASSPLWGTGSQYGTREMMANAMVNMMDAMGMFKPSAGGTTSASQMPMSNPFGSPSWMPGGAFGSPWLSPFPSPGYLPSMPGVPSRRGSPLEGVWEGRGGDLLIVQGNRFRIYSGGAGYVDGYLRVQGGRLAMYNPADERPQPFEYQESGGRLILRDEAGQVFLYRRLDLDATEPGGRSPFSAP